MNSSYRKTFFSSNDQDREEVDNMLNEEYITRQLDPEEKEATEMRCRCERCGRPIKIKIGAEKLCILCIADDRRAK